jgi:hypothetical protein
MKMTDLEKNYSLEIWDEPFQQWTYHPDHFCEFDDMLDAICLAYDISEEIFKESETDRCEWKISNKAGNWSRRFFVKDTFVRISQKRNKGIW